MMWEARQEQTRAFFQRRKEQEAQISKEILERFKVREALDIIRGEVWKEGEIIAPDNSSSLKLVSEPIERLMLDKRAMEDKNTALLRVLSDRIELDISVNVDRNSREPKIVVADTGVIADKESREASPLEMGILLWHSNRNLLAALDWITRRRIRENRIMSGEITHLNHEDAEDRFNEVWASIVAVRINHSDLPNQMREEEKSTIEIVSEFLNLKRTLSKEDAIVWDDKTKVGRVVGNH